MSKACNRVMFIISMSCSLSLAACNRSQEGTITSGDQVISHELECKFRTRNLSKIHCNVSIYSLVSDPKNYFGRDVFTYAFLELGVDGSIAIAPTPRTFELGDTFGCIRVANIHSISPTSKNSLKTLGIYAVSIGGRLEKPERNICMGTLYDAEITNARLISKQ